jgi:hypothetical protein
MKLVSHDERESARRRFKAGEMKRMAEATEVKVLSMLRREGNVCSIARAWRLLSIHLLAYIFPMICEFVVASSLYMRLTKSCVFYFE